jgi:ABC-type polysaccharide/polyol phosphate export permease
VTRIWRDVRDIIAEQSEYRELLMEMTKRDVLLRYKQTIMGFSWAVFMPIVNTTIFSVIFTRVAPIDSTVPYPVFAFCGLWAWNFFASSLRFSVTSLTSNVNLVTKVYFPKEIFPFSAVIVCLVDFLVGSIVLIGLLVYYQIPVTAAALQLPVVVLVQVVFTAGVALVFSMANLFFRDVKYLFEVLITVWMFATSVVYPLNQVGGILGKVLSLNPMTPIIDSYRAVLLSGELLGPSFWLASLLACVTLLVAWVLFHRSEFRFAESI